MDARKMIATLSRRASIIKYFADHSEIGRDEIVSVTNSLKDAETSNDFRMCNSITSKQEHGVIKWHEVKPEVRFYSTKSISEFPEISDTDTIMIDPNGIRCILTYDRGLFVRCELVSMLHYHTDITPLAKTFFYIPEKIDIKSRVHILGYACILKDDFNIVNEYEHKEDPYDDPFFMLLNAITSLNIDICRKHLISFIVTDGDVEKDADIKKNLLQLENFGFMVSPFVSITKTSNMDSVINNITDLAYRLGVPVFGVGMILSEYQRCIIKQRNELYETKVCGISVSLGDSGDIIPTIEFNELYTQFGKFTKLPLKSISELCSLNIHLGDTIVLHPEDDKLRVVYNRNISDHVYSSFDSYEYLTLCPICNSPLEFSYDKVTGKIIGARCTKHNSENNETGLF